jgi:predicted nuclease of restriction endonuclease-like (RecB) superfamily
LSWSHHLAICFASEDPAQQYFYLQMAVREHWSVRELKRQIESGLFLRYVSVAQDPEKCLPERVEQGPLLPFKDHYVLDFLGLEEQHTERQLRKAMLANVRDLFLEFGREFTLAGEEHPITIGNDTYRIDLLLFHRGLQCLVAVELKSGEFKPEHVGKCQFYLAALDEYARLPHEKPSVGLILCKSAKGLHMRLALTLAARRVGVATYQTALPDEELIRERLEKIAA